MTSILVALLLVATAPGEPGAAAIADSTMYRDATRGPAIVVHRQPTSEVVSIRLSILAPDPPGYSGAGLYMQYLVLPRLHERVDPLGGRVSTTRTDDAISFTVTGAARDLDELASALRAVLSPPSTTQTTRLRAVRRLQADQRAAWETAQAHVRGRMRATLFPEAPLVAGTTRTTLRLRDIDVDRLWSALYQPERLLVVAVGGVSTGEIEAAFANLPDLSDDDMEEEAEAIEIAAAPQSTRAWIGVAHRLDRVEPAVMTVLARLIQEDLEQALPEADIAVEHWWSRHGQALAIVVAVPESGAERAQALLPAAFERAADRSAEDPEALRASARTLWREMLLHGRAPAAMADIVGQFVEVSGNPHEANRFHHALTGLQPRNVREAAIALQDAPAVRVILPPQALDR